MQGNLIVLRGSEAASVKHTKQARSSGTSGTKRHPRPLAELGPGFSGFANCGLVLFQPVKNALPE